MQYYTYFNIMLRRKTNLYFYCLISNCNNAKLVFFRCRTILCQKKLLGILILKQKSNIELYEKFLKYGSNFSLQHLLMLINSNKLQFNFWWKFRNFQEYLTGKVRYQLSLLITTCQYLGLIAPYAEYAKQNFVKVLTAQQFNEYLQWFKIAEITAFSTSVLQLAKYHPRFSQIVLIYDSSARESLMVFSNGS